MAERRPGPVAPLLGHDDAHAAIRWITGVLGFTAGTVLIREAAVEHAELWHGDGVVLTSARRVRTARSPGMRHRRS